MGEGGLLVVQELSRANAADDVIQLYMVRHPLYGNLLVCWFSAHIIVDGHP